MRRYLPIFLNIHNERCVVVGGGNVAFRKVQTLLNHGARVKVVSPELCADLRNLVKAKKIDFIHRKYESDDLKEATIVVAATSNKEVNNKIYSDAKDQNILINSVDNPHLSNFISPSCLFRGDLCIAVSTSGKSPALARIIRVELEKHFDECYDSVVNLIDTVRSDLKIRGLEPSGREWQEALDLDRIVLFLRGGQREEAKKFLENRLRKKSEVQE